MKNGIAQKSLRKKLIWQFSSFVTAIMVVITIVVVAAMLNGALSHELKQSLNVYANHSLEEIERRVSFLEEKIKDFSKNHFVVNSLIDLQGRDAYLPQLVRDFSNTTDIESVTIVDFEGIVIYGGSEHTPDYKKEVYLRTALAKGDTICQLSRQHPKNVIVAVPIEYYHTPQGAVIAEFNLAGIAARVLTKNDKYCHKLYSKDHVIFRANAIPGDNHISIIQQAGEQHPLMKHLGISLQSGIFRSEFSAPVRNASTRLVLIGFCIIAVSAILAARIGNNIAKPVLQLCSRVAKAADGGNPKCSPIGTGDELEELAYVFDRRTEQLVLAGTAMQESEERYRKLIELSPDGIAIHTDQRLLFINQAGTRIFGACNSSDLLEKSILDFVHPDLQGTFRQRLGQLKKGKQVPWLEIRLIRLDNSEICVEVASIAFIFNGKPAIQSILRDITERKQAEQEREKLQARFLQVQKMEAIGTLAGGIAHDFNNILAAMIGFTELALDSVKEGTILKDNLNNVFLCGQRAKELVAQILAFSRQQKEELKPLRIAPIVKEAVKLLKASLPATIKIAADIQSDLIVFADPTQIHQVMMNLCTNAGHAMQEKGGTLKVELSETWLDADFVVKHADLKPGCYIRLTVSDTGHGIPAQLLDRIFDPFFTTKKAGDGTGMGLSVVHGIVKGLNGAITVYSEKGNGTTFNVFLSAVEKDTALQTRMEKDIAMGTERILFVDDELVLAKMALQMLESLGYEVTTRTSSIEALELFKSKPDHFDLVITDMTMPNMTGDELVRQIKAIRSELPIILCTGFSANIDQNQAERLGVHGFFLKPITKNDMAWQIRLALDQTYN
jgi:PAS domain S-box-containing protein